MDKLLRNDCVRLHIYKWVFHSSIQTTTRPPTRWPPLTLLVWSRYRMFEFACSRGSHHKFVEGHWGGDRWNYNLQPPICRWYYHILNIKKLLILFHQASGLKVNFHKSSILGIHIQAPELQCLASSLLCKIDKFPFTYLGLMIGGKASRIELWEPIISRLKKKLATWKSNMFNEWPNNSIQGFSIKSSP